jgi:hypothetical protein
MCRDAMTDVARARECPPVPERVPVSYPRGFDGTPIQATLHANMQGFYVKPSDGLEPSTPSLPWRFRGVTRVHGRSCVTRLLLQIGARRASKMRREASRVSFLMCPFCVHALVSSRTTRLKSARAVGRRTRRSAISGPAVPRGRRMALNHPKTALNAVGAVPLLVEGGVGATGSALALLLQSAFGSKHSGVLVLRSARR